MYIVVPHLKKRPLLESNVFDQDPQDVVLAGQRFTPSGWSQTFDNGEPSFE